MSALFHLPRATIWDVLGQIVPGGTASFYDAGTTNPRTVYSNPDLAGGHAISQPIAADGAGILPVIYLVPGLYKVVLKDASGNVLLTQDNVDTGVPAATGAVFNAIPSFFTATTTAGARSALGAAAAADLDALSATLGDLATLDTVTRSQLAAGFGWIVLQRNPAVATTSSLVTCTTVIPADDSIPQNTEGDAVLSGSFTPLSASSKLLIEVVLSASVSTSAAACAALFTNASAAAIRAVYRFGATNAGLNFDFSHEMNSPGTNAITFSVRAGPTSGSLYVNGVYTGGRALGGVEVAELKITEYLQI